MEAIITLLIGIVLCLYGNKLRNIMTVLIWFIIGYSLSDYLLSGIIDNSTVLFIVNLIIGIVVGSFSIKLEKISIFIAVSYITYESIKIYGFVDNATLNTIITILISLITGSLSLVLIKLIFILATSLYGGSLLLTSIPTLVPAVSSIIDPLVLVIVLCSIIIQFKISE